MPVRHPFAELIGLQFEPPPGPGRSRCVLDVQASLLNPHGVVHGAALSAMADTGMGAALVPALSPGETCATLDLHISYLRPATPAGGRLVCDSELVHRGRGSAHLVATISAEGVLLARASGNFAIRARPPAPPPEPSAAP